RDRAGTRTPRQPDHLRPLPRTGETERSKAFLEHQTPATTEQHRSTRSGAMKKKRGKKSNRGRKPNRAVRTGIKPDLETLPEVINRIIYGSPQWPMVAMRQSIKNSLQLKDNPFWNRLCAEFERAVLNGDDAAAADWFRRQANAIEKGGSPQRAQFNAKVV